MCTSDRWYIKSSYFVVRANVVNIWVFFSGVSIIGSVPPALAQSALESEYESLWTSSSNQKHTPEFGSTSFGHVAKIVRNIQRILKPLHM